MALLVWLPFILPPPSKILTGNYWDEARIDMAYLLGKWLLSL